MLHTVLLRASGDALDGWADIAVAVNASSTGGNDQVDWLINKLKKREESIS